MRLLAIAVLGLAVSLAGCESFARYRTDDTSVFRGTVVGEESDSFIRRGFPEGTVLDLEFDPDAAEGPMAGTITTTAPDGTRHLDQTPLRAIESLEHDLLSQYDFPGSGRQRNYLYVATPGVGPLAGRDAMVFVSLMDDGSIEVRVIAGSGDEARGDVYGVFRTRRASR